MESESERGRSKAQVECKADEIWGVLGRTWALLILKKLSESEATRFSEIKKAIPQISNTVLSDRLHEFEDTGLVTKKVYAEVPIRVEYRLTKQARDLGRILEQIDDWVARQSKEKNRKK